MTDHGTHDGERAIDSIRVGARHRKDLGDIDALAGSIRDLGLLQPITISPDGLLICGRRRLEAVRHLGWSTIRVTVRSGLSDGLHLLLAERDENTQRKDLSPAESLTLYNELRDLLRDDAADRQRGTRFGADDTHLSRGAAPGAAPRDLGEHGPLAVDGDARRTAARLVTGNDSYATFDRMNALIAWSTDESQPADVRQMALSEVERCNLGGPVRPAYERVRDEIERQAALRTAKSTTRPRLKVVPPPDEKPSSERRPRPRPTERVEPTPTPPPKRSARAFVATFQDLVGSEELYDVDQLASELSAEEVEQFLGVCAEIEHLRDALVTRRAARPTNPKSA